jgi:hypothetical protein
MNAQPPPLPFAAQRLVFLSLLFGMSAFAVVVGVVLQSRGGKGMLEPPMPVLDTVVIVVGATLAVAAFAMRSALRRFAESATDNARSHARFRAALIPLALLEGGCTFGLTTWLLDGTAVPGLAIAVVLFALAIMVVPFTDPDRSSS